MGWTLTDHGDNLSFHSKLVLESLSDESRATVSARHGVWWVPDLVPHVSRDHDKNRELVGSDGRDG